MRSNPLRWLFVAGALHVALTTLVFLVGHYQLLPNVFDQNGIGLTFAIDGATYRRLASEMATHWQTYGISPWLDIKAPLHARLYSIPFLLLGRFVGHNVLAAEPLNLFYYLATLTVVYRLGREIFNARAGLLAATIVALWPSLLMHSTQLIRDPLAILCFLTMLLVLTLLLNRQFAWPSGLVAGLCGAAVVTVFWLARGNMWNTVLVAMAVTLLLLSLRMIRLRKFMTANVIGLSLMIAAILFVPSRLESTTLGGHRTPQTPFAIPSASQSSPEEGIWKRAIDQIRNRRAGGRVYTARQSDIQEDVYFDNASDVVRFIPRAAMIGFTAPLPRMWFEQGSYGRAGRLISAAETLAMYFLYLPMIVCLWRERRRFTMWMVFLTATVSMIGLGLVVNNAGALYRLRYVFWIMLIVIAAQGLYLTTRATSSTKS